MPVFMLDMLSRASTCFYKSDLNFDQFDLNFGLIIYSYSGQFASTATTASSPSPRNVLCRFQLRGDSWGVANAVLLVSLFSRGEWRRSSSSLGLLGIRKALGPCVIPVRCFFCVNGKATSDGSLCVYPDRGGCGSVHLNTPLNRIERPGYPHPSA